MFHNGAIKARNRKTGLEFYFTLKKKIKLYHSYKIETLFSTENYVIR